MPQCKGAAPHEGQVAWITTVSGKEYPVCRRHMLLEQAMGHKVEPMPAQQTGLFQEER
jgi:hypothetical protein